MPAGARPFRSGTKNPMGKDRVRDRKIKKLSQMMKSQNKKPSKPIYLEKDRLKKMVEKELNKKSPYLKQERPKRSLPPGAKKTGGVKPGGFRKPTFNPKTMKPKGRR